MSTNQTKSTFNIHSIFSFLKEALTGSEHQDYTKGNINRAIFLLAIPMILEMCMESVFALVDIFFVGRLGKEATSTVGLTESVLTLVYSIAIGLSMAATAVVARRIGEKNPEAAAKTGAQAILITAFFSVVIGIIGITFASDIFVLMGANQEIISVGTPYMQLIFGANIVVMLLFLINGIFRGAGDASMAMHSLWIANVCNIILCPTLIYGIGDIIPAFGLLGAAMATTIGRGIGVLYQLYHLFRGKSIIKIQWSHFKPDWEIIKALFDIAWTGTLQFLIGSASWIFMTRITATFGSAAIAGYTVAIRVVMFFILPAWGMSNAAATLVGQNLGAKQPERAEESVWRTARYNAIFMLFVSLLFFFGADFIIGFMNNDLAVQQIATRALKIMSLGYIFYGVGMVMTSSFNGAGDTKTPTWVNLFGFWFFQIPLAYFMADVLAFKENGVFWAVLIAETGIAIAALVLFRRGTWKMIEV
jgi:putative MATE family efflux protein